MILHSTALSAALHAAILVPVVLLGMEILDSREHRPRDYAATSTNRVESQPVVVKLQTLRELTEPKKVQPPSAPQAPPPPAVEPPKTEPQVPPAPPTPPKAQPPTPEPKVKAKPKKRKRPAKRTRKLVSKADKPAVGGPPAVEPAAAAQDAPSDVAGAGHADGEGQGPAEGTDKDGAEEPAPPEPAPPAPPGPKVDKSALMAGYLRMVSRSIRRDFSYPRAAVRAEMEGRVLVDVTLDASGTIIKVALGKSSGFDILDRAALAAAKSVGKLPAPPEALGWVQRKVRVPFTFRLQ